MTGDMVTLPRAQVELLAKAARLFQQVFDDQISPVDAIDGAVELGLTVDRDLGDAAREIFGIDTEVDLSPAFFEALRAAEEACALIPAEPEPCTLK